MSINKNNILIPIRLFLRPSRVGAFSIENLFHSLLPFIQKQIKAELYVIRHPNIGLKNRLRILQEVKRVKSTLVNHITGDANFIALVLKGKNTILTIHDLESFKRTEKLQHYFIRFVWLYLPLKKVKYITVISEASKKKLLEEFKFLDAANVKVIPNCLTSNIKFSKKEFHYQEPVILQIGTKENKNLPNLIDAIKSLKCRLLIVGQLSEQVKELLVKRSVTYENFVNISNTEIQALYKRCDFVTLISKFEGFGLPILEANAAGRPVITSNISSMPEVAGEAAVLVDPNSSEAIRKGILSIIESETLRNDLIRKGQKNILRFAPEAVAGQYVQLYKQVITANET